MSDALRFDVTQLLCRRDALTTNETSPTSVVFLFAAHTDGTLDPVRNTGNTPFQGLLEQLEPMRERKGAVRGVILLTVAETEMDRDPIFRFC